MWTLKTVEVTPDANTTQFKATFTLSDGTTDFALQTTLSTRAELEQAIKDNIKRLEQRTDLIADVQAGTFELPAEPTPTEPTQLEQKQAQYDQVLSDYRELKELHEMDTAIVSANDLSNKANEVKNARTELENAKRNA